MLTYQPIGTAYSVPRPSEDIMSHLAEVKMNYLVHLARAWSIAIVLLIHGAFPFIWEHKASDMLCDKD